MKKNTFDYQGAINEGYSDEEISSFLREKHPTFDYEGAINEGYNPQEVNQFLSTYKPEKSNVEKGLRTAAQYGLGILEASPVGLAYDIAVAPLNTEGFHVNENRQQIVSNYEDLLMQKYAGGEWTDKDEEYLKYFEDKIKNPENIKKETIAKPYDVSIRGLAEKATGQDLQPEGILEKAANWAGYLKDPKKILNLFNGGMTKGDIAKAILPTGKEALRGVTAGSALQLAENNEFGPIGTIAAAIIGDVFGAGIGGAFKAGKEFLKGPKEYLAKKAAQLTPKEKLNVQQDLIKDFREAGLQADLGTVTDNNLTKWMQARLAQSGLTGKALQEFKKELTEQFKNEYKTLADSLGQAKFQSLHEAGNVAKEGIKTIRDSELASTRKFYENASKSLKSTSFVNPRALHSTLERIEKQLTPGKLKSTEQNAVLNVLDKLKQDIMTSDGKSLKMANVNDLMNNKIALNDIINYEVQGGTKQLLKGVVSELDRAIISHGKDNLTFAKNYITANKKFAQHAKEFRNKDILRLLNEPDPSKLLDRMNTVHGQRTLEKILNKSPQGKEIYDNLKRMKFDKIIGDNLVDSTTQQVKLGTFSKLLEKGKNKEIIKELLGSKAFKSLEKLQKNAGKLADTMNKFYNASQSGVVAADAAVFAKAMGDIGHLLYGNPWPLMKLAGGITGARKLSSLMADPEFIHLVEDAILAASKDSPQMMQNVANAVKPYVRLLNQIYKNEGNPQQELQ